MSVFAQRNGTSATGASLILGGTFSLEQAAIINLELEIRSQVQLTCTETEFNECGHVEKLITSADMYRNQVQRTWFLCRETEFNELGFYTGKLSSLNSVSVHGNRVR